MNHFPTWYEQGRFQVIGEVLTQYSGIVPSDPILDPLWSFAEQEGVPVGIHINDFPITCPESISNECTPLAMKEVLEQYPDLKVYIMHAGYPHLQDMIELMESYPQVYVGITLPPKGMHRYLEGLVDAGFCDRIMFGSDQMLWPELIELFANAINKAEFLTEQQKHAIFYENEPIF
ncbi:MAG: amidohydrolase family protein [Balneolaceae bacterium]|nr:amidohydrolase family protein [Balneolaceae bacterium]